MLTGLPRPKFIRLGYWDIRGLGAPLRMLLQYSGVEHEVVYHKEAEDGSWFDEKKPELRKKNALANLPYLEMDDGLVVCESNACLIYLQESLGLSPPSDAARLQSLALLSMCMCTRNDLALLQAGPFAKYEASLRLSETPYFCGDAPCAADFAIWEMLDQHTMLAAHLGEPPPLADMPLLAAHYERLRALPQLAGYFESPAYRLPCNSPALTHWS